MGGSKIHCKISGVADLEVADDESCLASGAQVPVVLSLLQSRAASDQRDVAIRSTAGPRNCTTSSPPIRARLTTSTR